MLGIFLPKWVILKTCSLQMEFLDRFDSFMLGLLKKKPNKNPHKKTNSKTKPRPRDQTPILDFPKQPKT